jgi:PAS domain S-box-containing protein
MISAITWLIADLMWKLNYPSSAILYWDAAVSLGFFLIVVLFMSKFRELNQHLEKRVAERTATLEAEIAERKRVEEVLRDSEERYRALYEDNPSMYFTVDSEGRVLSVNKFGAEQLGYTDEELVGQSVLDVFYEDDKKSVLEQLITCLQNPGRAFHWEFRKVRKDGSMLWVREDARAAWDTNGNMVVLIVCEDINERKRAEEELQKVYNDLEIRVQERTLELAKTNETLQAEIVEHKWADEALKESFAQLSKQNRYETIISTITRSVHRSINLQDVLENAVEAVKQNVNGSDYVGIYIVEGEEAVLKAYRSFSDQYLEQAGRIPYPKGFTWKTIIDGKPVYCGDVDQDTTIGPAGKKLGTQSYASMPIHSKGETVGAININSLVKYAFDKDELKLLEIVAQQIDIAINNASQAEALRESEETLKESLAKLTKKDRYETIISTVTRSVHKSINSQEVLENAVDVMSKNIDGAENVSIYLVEGEEAVMKAYRGYPDSFAKRVGTIPYPKDFTWKTIMEEKATYCADIDSDTVVGRVGREIGVNSYLSMPIRYEGKTAGVINISSLRKDAFDEEDLNVLEIVAQQIEVAINNAKITEALRQSEERYRILFDQSPVGVYIFDKEFKVTRCNESMAEILQSSRDKIEGFDMRMLKDQSFMPAMKKALEGETYRDESFYEATTSSAKLWLSVFVSPLCSANGNVIGGVAVIEDTTQRKQVEEALKKAHNELEMRVDERTAELVKVNETLQSDIAERKRVEEELKNSREQLRALAARLQSIREEEGRRIGREVHDNLGQSLTGLNMDLFELESQISELVNETRRDSLLKRIRSMFHLIDTTVQAVREIATELRPRMLDDLGLVPAIEWQVQDFQKRTGIQCGFSTEDINLDQERSTAIFRILQETLTNVARHAKATRVNIRLREDNDSIMLEVEDDGRGITEEEIYNPRSLGLLGMRERALLFGGEINITGRQGRGTTLTLCIPIKGLEP